MTKILVSGNAGAGKSSLGKLLAKRHQLPLYGLDKIVWKEGWVKTPKEERGNLEREILSQERCAFNVITRFIKNGLGSRPELPKNCPEYIGFLKALKTNFIFHKVTKPWLLDETQRNSKAKFIHIKNYRELNHIINMDIY